MFYENLKTKFLMKKGNLSEHTIIYIVNYSFIHSIMYSVINLLIKDKNI